MLKENIVWLVGPLACHGDRFYVVPSSDISTCSFLSRRFGCLMRRISPIFVSSSLPMHLPLP